MSGYQSRLRRVEASVSMQGRMDIRTVAEIEKYFEGKGLRIGTVSQLISSSLELLREILKNNEELPDVIDDAGEAFRYMQSIGLIRQKMKDRIGSRMHAAASFQGLRTEGVDPKFYSPDRYKMIHNRDAQVNQPVVESDRDGQSNLRVIDDEMWEKAQKRIMEEAKRETRERIRMADNFTEDIDCDVEFNKAPEKELTEKEKLIKRKDEERIAYQRKYYEEHHAEKEKEKVEDDRPRKLSISELEAKARDIQEKDREYLKQVNEMSCVPPTMIEEVEE